MTLENDWTLRATGHHVLDFPASVSGRGRAQKTGLQESTLWKFRFVGVDWCYVPPRRRHLEQDRAHETDSGDVGAVISTGSGRGEETGWCFFEEIGQTLRGTAKRGPCGGGDSPILVNGRKRARTRK